MAVLAELLGAPANASAVYTFLLYSVLALVGAVYLAGVSWATESLAFAGYRFLERLGLVHRLVPEVPVEDRHVHWKKNRAVGLTQAGEVQGPPGVGLRRMAKRLVVCQWQINGAFAVTSACWLHKYA